MAATSRYTVLLDCRRLLFALALGGVSQSLTATVGSQLTTWMNQVQVRDQGDALLQVLIYAFGLSLLFFAFQSALFCPPKKLLCVQT